MDVATAQSTIDDAFARVDSEIRRNQILSVENDNLVAQNKNLRKYVTELEKKEKELRREHCEEIMRVQSSLSSREEGLVGALSKAIEDLKGVADTVSKRDNVS